MSAAYYRPASTHRHLSSVASEPSVPVDATPARAAASIGTYDNTAEWRAERVVDKLREAKTWDAVAAMWQAQPGSFGPSVMGFALYYAAVAPGGHALLQDRTWLDMAEAAQASLASQGATWTWAELARATQGVAWVVNPHPAARWAAGQDPPTAVRAPPSEVSAMLEAVAQEVLERAAVEAPSVSSAARCVEGFAYAYAGRDMPHSVSSAMAELLDAAAHSQGKWSAASANSVLVGMALSGVHSDAAAAAALSAVTQHVDWYRSELLASSLWAIQRLQGSGVNTKAAVHALANKAELSRWAIRPRDMGTIAKALVSLGAASPRCMACLSEVASDAAWNDKIVGENRELLVQAFKDFFAAGGATAQPELGSGSAVRATFKVVEPTFTSDDSAAAWPWNVRTAAPLSILAM